MTASDLRRTKTAQECADTLGVSIDKACDLLKSGKLRGRKFGNRWVVLDEELERFIDRELRGGAA